MRLKLPKPDSLGSRGIDEPLQFVRVVNVGHETLGHLRNCCRQRRLVDEAATSCIAVEATQRVVLAAPVVIHTSCSQELFDTFSCDVGDVDVYSHAPAKRVQQAVRTLKIFAHRLSKRYVL